MLRPFRSRDLIVVSTGYVLAVIVAAATVLLLERHPLLEVLIADLLATGVIFLWSVATRNSSCYDPYWSVAPPVIGLWFVAIGEGDGVRQLLVMGVVLFWSLRLTGNWVYGWQGLSDEDWRYRNLAAAAGKLWWPLSLVGIHLFPTLVVYLGCLPLYPALAVGAYPLGALDAIALLLAGGSIVLELQADRELHRFRSSRKDRRRVLTSGVWAWCRHPNYLGEIGFWLGLFLFGVAAHGGIYPGTWSGPLAMLGLFILVSIPMIERKLAADKPDYAAYRRRTRMLVPGVL